jgi:hypothetical protein
VEDLTNQVIRIRGYNSAGALLNGVEDDSSVFTVTTDVVFEDILQEDETIPTDEKLPTDESVPPPPTETDEELSITVDEEDRRVAALSEESGPSPFSEEKQSISVVYPGQFIRSYSNPAVYLVTADYQRRPFVDAVTYFTYADTWSEIVWVTDATLPTMDLVGPPMLPKAGVVLIKVPGDKSTYLIEPTPDGDIIRWISPQKVAEDLLSAAKDVFYGEDAIDHEEEFGDYVIDVDEATLRRYIDADKKGPKVSSTDDATLDLSIMKTRQQIFEAINAGV